VINPIGVGWQQKCEESQVPAQFVEEKFVVDEDSENILDIYARIFSLRPATPHKGLVFDWFSIENCPVLNVMKEVTNILENLLPFSMNSFAGLAVSEIIQLDVLHLQAPWGCYLPFNDAANRTYTSSMSVPPKPRRGRGFHRARCSNVASSPGLSQPSSLLL
jgi:hypothetical protein